MDESTSYQYFEDVNLGLLRLWGKRTGKKVLDVGCGFATTSQALQRLGNHVTGIESSDAACKVARQRIGRVLEADLQDLDQVGVGLGADRFDALIFADVLEHLAWPGVVLESYLRWLAPGGSVFVSLPNVGLWSVRLALLAGKWEYQETGVLDRTHLRFFTRASARRMLAQAGLQPAEITFNPGLVRPFVPLVKKVLSKPEGSRDARAPGSGETSTAKHDPASILNSPAYQLYLRTVHPVERVVASLWPGMLAFQMVFEAKVKS